MIDDLDNIFFDTFRLGKDTDLDNLSSFILPKWDSLNHIKLIITIEKKFNIKFEAKIISELNSYKKILEHLKKINVI